MNTSKSYIIPQEGFADFIREHLTELLKEVPEDVREVFASGAISWAYLSGQIMEGDVEELSGEFCPSMEP